MSRRIEGKRVVITGAASGIGQAAASRFAAEGAKVGCVDADRERAGAAAAQAGAEALALPADVTVEEEIADAMERAVAAWGGLDVVVANAGVQLFGQDARAHELELSVWRRTVEVNLTGVFLTCKHGIRALLGSGGGSVIITASPTGLFGLAPGFDAYSASKAGVWGLTRVLANDYARDRIRVNAVVPGFTDTPLVRSIMENEEERERLLRAIPLRRPGTAEEVAAMMLFLASDESSYATGAGFFVDGGITAI